MKRKLKIAGIALGTLAVLLVGAYFLLYRGIPYFQKMEKTRITQFTKERIKISSDVVCFNPNHVSVRLADCDFDVYANGVMVAEVKQKFGTTVGADSEFRIPLNISFSPLKLFKARDLIGASFSSLKSKRIDLRYDGTVTVGLVGQDISIGVDVEDWVALKPEGE